MTKKLTKAERREQLKTKLKNKRVSLSDQLKRRRPAVKVKINVRYKKAG